MTDLAGTRRWRFIALAVALVAAGWAGWGLARAGSGQASAQAVALLPGGEVLVGTEGALWRLGPDGSRARILAQGVRQILVDPGQPAQLYALTVGGQALRSRDGGRTWAPLPGHGLPRAPIRALAYDPSGPVRLVALVAGHGYYQSDLSGDMWMQLGSQDVPDALALAISPLDPRTVLVGTPQGLWRSTNQGMTFAAAGAGRPWDLPGPVLSLAVAGDRSLLVAATGRGLYASRNGGLSWSSLASPGLPDVVAVAVHPRQARTLAALSKAGQVAVSRDGGRTWEVHNR